MDTDSPVPYFPVSEQYLVPGPLYRLGAAEAGSKIIEVDTPARRALFLDNRQRLAGTGLLPLRSHPPDLGAEQIAAAWLANVLRNELPEPLHPIPFPAQLDDLVANLQEDVVVLRDDQAHTDPRKRWRTVYVNVAHPSGWCPQCIPNQHFAWIHRHVAGFGVTDQRAQLAQLTGNDPWVRFVWTVAPDAALDRRKCEVDPTHGQSARDWDAVRSLESLYFRVERQVFVRLCGDEDDIAVFLIRIFQDPLTRLNPAQRETLACALEAMETAVATYKGLLSHREKIIRWLRA